MKRTLRIVLLVTAAALVPFGPRLAAQEGGGLTLEVRGAYGFPVGDFSDDLGAESDFGFGAGAILGLTPGFGVYAGWARDRFDCDLCGPGDDIRVSGVEGGIALFLSQTDFTPWVRLGAVAHRTRVHVDGVTSRSDRAIGVQGALGVEIPLGSAFSLAPAVRYTHIPSEFEILNLEVVSDDFETDIQYFSVDLGLRLHTGGW